MAGLNVRRIFSGLLWISASAVSGASAATQFEHPVGIALGQHYLTSAYISDGNPITITKIEASAQYVHLMHSLFSTRSGANETTSPSAPDQDAQNRLIGDAIKQIESATATQLKQPVDIRALALPQYFSHETFQSIVPVAEKLLPSYNVPYQAIRHVSAARLAYELNSCKGFGLPTDCDMEEGHVTLFITISQDSAEVHLAQLSDIAIGFDDSRLTADLGWPPGQNNANAWMDRFTVLLEDFIAKNFKVEGGYTTLDYLEAIVLSGDADDGAFKFVREVLDRVLPGREAIVRDTISPGSVAAAGAARWAKLNRDRPDKFPTYGHVPSRSSESEHDEL